MILENYKFALALKSLDQATSYLNLNTKKAFILL